MKIFDCTSYYSEDLILDIRFNVLNEKVYKFIVVESLFSHSGQKKKLNFDINNFKKFKDKIIYLVIEKEPNGIRNLDKNNQESSTKNLNLTSKNYKEVTVTAIVVIILIILFFIINSINTA